MAIYQSSHSGSQIDSGVTKGLLIPTPASQSDSGKVPVVNVGGTGYALQNPPSGMANPMTTAGDIIVGGSGGTPIRLGLGTVGQALTTNGSVLSWINAVTFEEAPN